MLGLVHGVDITERHVAVRVPDPAARGRLLWANVWVRGFAGGFRGTMVGRRVQANLIEDWRRQGGRDQPLFALEG